MRGTLNHLLITIITDVTQVDLKSEFHWCRLSKVHVHLEGGNLCDSDPTCAERCDQDGDGQVDNSLCTGPVAQARQDPTLNLGTNQVDPALLVVLPVQLEIMDDVRNAQYHKERNPFFDPKVLPHCGPKQIMIQKIFCRDITGVSWLMRCLENLGNKILFRSLGSCTIVYKSSKTQ